MAALGDPPVGKGEIGAQLPRGKVNETEPRRFRGAQRWLAAARDLGAAGGRKRLAQPFQNPRRGIVQRAETDLHGVN